ncbi:hypothetical protein CHS0354_021261 [Potamilus streckersoni]|uniref:Uncharacterized protein n=1 Tax=Potamilus streckersoni TaxID=2493646 RepID=A0AAE0S489_9BIVA|nr:hypothetical protein CHS0354_021261 [Potamilus streckersoni]
MESASYDPRHRIETQTIEHDNVPVHGSSPHWPQFDYSQEEVEELQQHQRTLKTWREHPRVNNRSRKAKKTQDNRVNSWLYEHKPNHHGTEQHHTRRDQQTQNHSHAENNRSTDQTSDPSPRPAGTSHTNNFTGIKYQPVLLTLYISSRERNFPNLSHTTISANRKVQYHGEFQYTTTKSKMIVWCETHQQLRKYLPIQDIAGVRLTTQMYWDKHKIRYSRRRHPIENRHRNRPNPRTKEHTDTIAICNIKVPDHDQYYTNLITAIEEEEQATMTRTTGNPTKSNPPWKIEECKAAIQSKKCALALFKRTKTSLTFNAYKQQETLTKEVIKQAKLTSCQNYNSTLNHQSPTREVSANIKAIKGKSPILIPFLACTQNNRKRA